MVLQYILESEYPVYTGNNIKKILFCQSSKIFLKKVEINKRK